MDVSKLHLVWQVEYVLEIPKVPQRKRAVTGREEGKYFVSK